VKVPKPSASTIVVIMLVAACACLVLGVLILWGLGWALLAGSAGLFLMAAALARGSRE